MHAVYLLHNVLRILISRKVEVMRECMYTMRYPTICTLYIVMVIKERMMGWVSHAEYIG
jgi:hypothetical protein